MSLADVFRQGKVGMKSDKYKRIAESLHWRQAYQKSTAYEYTFESKFIIEVKQIDNGELKGLGTGCFVWPAAHVLCKYLELCYTNATMQGMRVCDIGSGTGITGIVAGLLGAEVVLTDQQCMLPLLRLNTKTVVDEFAHMVSDRSLINVCEYEWGQPPDAFDVNNFDLVIISDCVLPKLYPIDILVEAVSRVIGPNTMALFSYEHRIYPYYDPRVEFRRIAALYNLEVKTIPLANHHPIYSAEDIELWDVRRISSGSTSSEIDNGNNNLHFQLGRLDVVDFNNVECLHWGDDLEEVPCRITLERQSRLLSIKQDPCKGAIGNILWPSSVVASRYILGCESSRHSFFYPPRDKCCSPLAIELGAGCGLVSICLALKGYDVITTDTATVMPLLKSNCNLITCHLPDDESVGTITPIEFNWCASRAGLSEAGETDGDNLASNDQDFSNFDNVIDAINHRNVDLIVCSDCCYSSAVVPSFLAAITTIAQDDTKILIVNEHRSSLDTFISKARISKRRPLHLNEISMFDKDIHVGWTANGSSVMRPIKVLVGKFSPST